VAPSDCGDDGQRRAIGPGYAAPWEPGEEHEASSDEGLTAVRIEVAFDVWAISVTRDIIVSDYDPAWPDWFETVRDYVWPDVADVALRIDHVRSTAVPGLASKPIIDLDVVVPPEPDVRSGDRAARHDQIPVAGRPRCTRTGGVPGDPRPGAAGAPLYVVVENNKAHLDHWLPRDLLREDAGHANGTPPSRDATRS
jgi:GrpB-like predicted nucleotidyltransferase (UPF0157 family)